MAVVLHMALSSAHVRVKYAYTLWLEGDLDRALQEARSALSLACHEDDALDAMACHPLTPPTPPHLPPPIH